MKPAWLAIASAGSKGSRTPSPSPSMLCATHVSGMNCARPWAPTGLTAREFQPDSCWSWAASSGAVMPLHVRAALRTRSPFSAGTVPGRRPAKAAGAAEASAATPSPSSISRITTNSSGTETITTTR